MKHLKNILSIALAAALMLMLASSAFAAPVIEFDYDKEIFFENFESVADGTASFEALPLMHIQKKTALANKISKIDGNNVVVLAKTSTASEGNYARIRCVSTPVAGSIQDIYGLNLAPLSQVQASMDFYIASAAKFTIAGYLYNGGVKSANMITVDEGKLKIGSDETDVEINNNTWYTISFTFNFETGRYAVEIRERGEAEALGVFTNKSIPSAFSAGIHSFGILFTNSATGYEVYIDNMKYAVPSAHVNEYASDLAKLDFEETSDGYETVTDEIAISAEATQSYYTYEKFGKYPEKIKAEASIKRNEVGETALYFGDTQIVSLGQDGLVSADSSVALSTDSEWTKVTLYMDFASRTFDVLMDGEEIAADAAIPAGVTTPEAFRIGVENGGTLLVDYMKVSALAPYGSNKITGYLDENGAFSYGYVVNNPASEERAYSILKVKYDKNGGYLGVEEITSHKIAPATMEIQKFADASSIFSSNTNYYRFFMLDANTLEPLN